MELNGGCLCGKTRYLLLTEPVWLADCHCVDCRRSAGAPFITWGSVRPGRLQVVAGNPRRISHANRLRSFAECCGTPLFFEENESPEWIDVTIASLDRPDPFAPQKSHWTEDKLPWIVLNPHIPSHLRRSTDAT